MQSVSPPDPVLLKWLQGAALMMTVGKVQESKGSCSLLLSHFVLTRKWHTLSSAEDRRVVSYAWGAERACQGDAGHLPNSETTAEDLKREL